MTKFATNSNAVVLAMAVAILLVVSHQAGAGVIDDIDEEMNYNPDEVQSYLNALESYYQGRNEKSKRWVFVNKKRVSSGMALPSRRGMFCVRRDNSCPYAENGRDICCKGSQCSCNIFGQNCKCSTIGLFQRLGRR